jgi:hypothetical protein
LVHSNEAAFWFQPAIKVSIALINILTLVKLTPAMPRAAQNAKPTFHLIEPGTVRWDE